MAYKNGAFLALFLAILAKTFGMPLQQEFEETTGLISNSPEIIHLEVDESGQCIFMKLEEGTYSFRSPGSTEVCGLYLVAEADQIVELEFRHFDIGCSKGGLLSVIDGWELSGQFFPGDDDHPLPLVQRFQEFCDKTKPWRPFLMSQNVGLIEFRIPTRGDGFTVDVRFRENPKPCNVVLQHTSATHTLRNYGRRVNCSASIIFPVSFHVLSTSVGVQAMRAVPELELETGLVNKCKKRSLEDYVELKGGDGLDPGRMTVVEEFCGLDSFPRKRTTDVACGNTAIRLVSSGRFENAVTVSFSYLMDYAAPSFVCPNLFAGL